MMNHYGAIESVTPWLALWGAAISTILGALKVRGIWKERFRIDVDALLTGSVELGNTVTIRNLGGKPVIVAYWELVWRSGWWPCRQESLLSSPAEFARDIQIAAGASHSLRFADSDYFDWSARALKGRSIWISLRVAGRKRRVLRKLTG
ncbi:MAG: hypothetical protein F4Y71_06985 [Acidobacteria bacterium]|nr:hypothetical protein [Acidobacteriota bacterium]MYG74204.1 hypothetical protein [Acidobacteriota bacterium]